MEVLVKIAQVVTALSILVLVHELGHFAFARLFKVRVEKFYLFFDIKFALFRYKPKNSHTEYGIGWLPLGGYCKISGMIDESMDTEQMNQPPQPWEFRTKPAWQRLLMMIGGVMFNVLLAFFLYAMILFTWGEQNLLNRDVKYGIATDSLSYSMGFRNGDKILMLDNQSAADIGFYELQLEMIREQVKTVTVERDGKQLVIPMGGDYLKDMLNTPGMFEPMLPFVVGQIPDDSPNFESGLLAGDCITQIDTIPVEFFQSARSILASYKGQTIPLQVLRNDFRLTIPVKVSEAGLLGIAIEGRLNQYFNLTTYKYGFFESFPAGISKAYTTIANYLKELKLIFTPRTEAYKGVGSFITIGKIFPGTWDWHAFWSLTALLSIMLAVINLLPIPALDGGHVIFLLYEMVTRRKPSDKFLEYAQVTGLFILLFIMVYAISNDIFRHLLN
ncbi:MAG: RIP metalloprotease RseP [Prevotellaceae bacterium]|jgi:regulator of sigma E protease|nr:RIP metalloprotease RseP [Prevotellaceae bacterium]